MSSKYLKKDNSKPRIRFFFQWRRRLTSRRILWLDFALIVRGHKEVAIPPAPTTLLLFSRDVNSRNHWTSRKKSITTPHQRYTRQWMLGGEKTLTISPVKKRGSSSLKPLTSDHENGACCDIILSADQRDARLEKKKHRKKPRFK